MKVTEIATKFLERVPLHIDDVTYNIMHSNTNTPIKDLRYLLELFNGETGIVPYKKVKKILNEIHFRLQCTQILKNYNEFQSKKNAPKEV
jgi:hypothetical protein